MQDDTQSDPEHLRRKLHELTLRNAELESAVRESRQTIAFLLKSERKFRSLAENMPDVIVWFDRDFRHLYVNPAMERVTGLRPGECIGKTNEELGMPLKHVEFWNEHLRTVFRTGEVRAMEFSIPSPGGIRYFHYRMAPVFSDDGAVESVISVARDITGIRRMEARLRENRDSLAEVQEMSRLGSSSYDFRTGRMVWSDTLYSILGLPPGTEPDIDRYRSLLHPDDRERLNELQRSALQSLDVQRHELEYRIVTPAGETRHLAVVSHIYRDEEKIPVKVISVMQDITERKRIEDIRRTEEERLRQVVSNMPILMDAFDENGMIITWNRECELVTGYSAMDVIGNPDYLALFYPDPEYRKAVQESLGRKDAGFREWTLTRKDGSKRTVAWSNIGLRTPIPGWSHWAVGVDVTERWQAEGERERLIRQLQQSLGEVKTLRGLIPICSHCKKIRDDAGYWQQIEKYIVAHSEASFSHGICPDCMRKYYTDIPDKKK